MVNFEDVHIASDDNCFDIVKLLIEKGNINIMLKTNKGKTALDLAKNDEYYYIYTYIYIYCLFKINLSQFFNQERFQSTAR